MRVDPSPPEKMWFLVGFHDIPETVRWRERWPSRRPASWPTGSKLLYDTLENVCREIERVNGLRQRKGWRPIIGRPYTWDTILSTRDAGVKNLKMTAYSNIHSRFFSTSSVQDIPGT